MARIIVVGSAGVQVHVPPHEAPGPGAMRLIPALDIHVGGVAVHTAITAARVGASTAFAASLGDDLPGHALRAKLKEESVDCARLRLLPGRSSPATLVEKRLDGKRSYLHHRGTNQDFQVTDKIIQAPCKVFHLAAPEMLPGFWPQYAIDCVRKLKVAGRIVSLDTYLLGKGRKELTAGLRDHRRVVELVDVLFTTAQEARLLTELDDLQAGMRKLHESGVEVVVIKGGARGALVSWPGGYEEVKPPQGTVVDETGANDSFVGAFLAGYAARVDPERCARMGCAVAALCVRSQGALTGTSNAAALKKAVASVRMKARTKTA